MLKKIRDMIANPLEARKRKPAPPLIDGKVPHVHSFSCACKDCVDETNRLTRERLKAQGA